jgi:hypothetical protein
LPKGTVTAEDVRRVAFAWQATIHTRLSAMIEADHRPLADATGPTGSFYAATGDGLVYAITLRIAATPEGTLQDIEEPGGQTGYLVATGTNEAKARALAVAPRYATLAWPARLEAIESETIRAEMARYGSKSDIGGPVDLIEITPDGPVWLRRKAVCRQ